ncbi:MAG: hypothetical protein Q9190_003785 [Brigantiaea leucoxantha]
MISRQKERTSQIAKEQQQALEARLKKNNLEMPPFQFLELIGKGAYGRVFKANDLKRKQIVALKVVDVDPHDYKVHFQEKDDSISTVLHEIKVLRQLRDSNAKNINLYIDAFPIHSQLWIVTEYCPGGSLHTLMQGTGSKLEEKYIVPVARELAEALKAIHAAGIIHRDVKAANVMIHERGALQVIDFGVAGLLQTSKEKRTTVIGTPHWMAPEMSSQIAQRGPPSFDYGTEIDVWAYGCTLFEIATGHPPYHRAAVGRALTMMHKRKIPELREDGFPPSLVELVSYVLQSDPGSRPSMESVAQHHYVINTEHSHPTESLADLVGKYYRWEYSGGQRSSLFMPGGAEAAAFPDNKAEDDLDWNFSTTVNFDQQISNSLSAPEQPANSLEPSGSLEKGSSHFQHIVSPSETTSFHSYPELYTPTSSADLMEFMGDSPEASTPTGDSASKSSGKMQSLDKQSINKVSDADEVSVQRGEQSLGAIFDTSAAPYQYGPSVESQSDSKASSPTKAESTKPSAHRSHSDLPLRNETSESSVQRMEVESDKSSITKKIPNIDLANVGTIKANRMNRSHGSTSDSDTKGDEKPRKGSFDKRATMDWKFPAAEEAPAPAIPGHRGTMDWSFASASMIADENQEEPLPARPTLRHMQTAPVGDASRIRGSYIDLDALYESESHDDTSAGLPTAPASDDDFDDDDYHFDYGLSDESPPVTGIPASISPHHEPHPESLMRQPRDEQDEWIGFLLDGGMDKALANALVLNDPSDPFDESPEAENPARRIINQWLDNEEIFDTKDRSELLQDALRDRSYLIQAHQKSIKHYEEHPDGGSEDNEKAESKQEDPTANASASSAHGQFKPVEMPDPRLFQPECPPDLIQSESTRVLKTWIDSVEELHGTMKENLAAQQEESAATAAALAAEGPVKGDIDDAFMETLSDVSDNDFEGIMRQIRKVTAHYADRDAGHEGGDEA